MIQRLKAGLVTQTLFLSRGYRLAGYLLVKGVEEES